jgi:P4 family phage/plasmid primase-like protien
MSDTTTQIDKTALHTLLDMGATFFGVRIMKDAKGKYQKVPECKSWQSIDKLPIESHESLQYSIYQAYGFRPIDAGIWVLDLDEKHGKSGLANLAKLLGNPEWLDFPEVCVDTPNGRHYYFQADSVPDVLKSTSGTSLGGIEGVDVRCSRRGFIVAPGSLGYSENLHTFQPYGLSGNLLQLPKIPDDLKNLLLSRVQEKRENNLALVSPVDVIYSGRTGLEDIGNDDLDSYAELFRAANELEHDPKQLSIIVTNLFPNAEWDGSVKRYRIGDLHGNAGSSGYISAEYGVGDWGTDTKTDLINMVCTAKGLDKKSAARLMLRVCNVPDPSSIDIPQSKPIDFSKLSNVRLFPLTDVGNSERIVHAHGEDIRYSYDNSQWLEWDGTKWRVDKSAKMDQMAKSIARDIREKEIHLAQDKEAQEKIYAWSMQSEGIGRQKAMVELASSAKGIRVEERQFDTALDSFNVSNGEIDLRTGELHKHRRDSYFTKCSPVTYNPSASAPKFQAFLDDITCNRVDLKNWMRCYFGYCLSGRISENIFAFFYGNGANGKSVLVEILTAILGEYSGTTRPEILMQDSRGGSNSEGSHALASLKGRRLVTASESDAGAKISVGRIKEMTGGDVISCRHLYGQLFDYVPTWKIALMTNHKPSIRTQDMGTWRRIKYVPFDFTCLPENMNKRLAKEIIQEEAEGVLAWLVSGAVDWYKDGMPYCPTIDDATREYKEEEDFLAEFFEDNCVKGPGIESECKILYTNYKTWARVKEVKEVSRNSFGRMMTERGYMRKHAKGRDIYVGIGIKDTQHSELSKSKDDQPPWDMD